MGRMERPLAFPSLLMEALQGLIVVRLEFAESGVSGGSL